jgi:nucleoside-diphosphate-sugar epimerase/2-polyprenyl-3-methyl-5-hydroxy-6-metoxy-1,4-benzoquinol methylase/quercetin dioxygenase-like cupin family protein
MIKIVITGGLGYIGTELCKLYSGEARYKNITVIDSKFVSERVKQLRDWGINFIQGSILDEELLKKELGDADIIFHLAGITDVAYVKTDVNQKKDEEIKKIGVDGTRNIIKFSNKNAKIIFPSTHVVYEGFSDAKFDISEDIKPCPVLTYSQGKVQSEEDLINSDRNYVILRLASVYGYSTDTMRISIMPNLFSKITALNGEIKLFSGGVQMKSLVPLVDVARCFKFMSESNINREIFHLSKENMTVKEVALLCKEYNNNLSIIETDDEIPNVGYTISNKKLLNTGFEFRYNIKDSIKEMINNWSKKDLPEELEYIINGQKEFIDDRGKISNYELPEPINLIGYIESKTGSVRANHYHPIQEQKCLLIKGKYVSVIKDLSNPNSVIETRLINPGDIAVIKPNVAHAMVFLEDSIFLNLVRGEREHENYGITHTIPYILVDEQFRKDLINGYKKNCRVCDNTHMKKVISLGKSPLANNLLNDEFEKYDTYPLEMDYCPKCHNVQLNYIVESNKMFDNYLYVSSTSNSFKQHFENAALKYIKMFNLNEESTVVDIGSNDGIALKPLVNLGINCIGVEPAKNICEIAIKNGVKTINEYFTEHTFKEQKFADVVTASNVFAHSDGLKSMTINVFNILKDSGTFIVEVQYLLDTVKDLTFDNIYHEHVNYWSVTSLNYFFNSLGFKLIDVERINTHGGSIRVYVKKHGEPSENVKVFIKNEIDFGLQDYNTYKNFAKKINEIKNKIFNEVQKLKKETKYIVGFGSPAKATTSLNYYGLTNRDIKFIVEDNRLKHNKTMPGTGIKIVSTSELQEDNYTVLILAWNFSDYIKENNKDLINKGIKFISIKDLI